jgi:hypothetical protein
MYSLATKFNNLKLSVKINLVTIPALLLTVSVTVLTSYSLLNQSYTITQAIEQVNQRDSATQRVIRALFDDELSQLALIASTSSADIRTHSIKSIKDRGRKNGALRTNAAMGRTVRRQRNPVPC